jgi:putative ABC transport system substrate-binding protein
MRRRRVSRWTDKRLAKEWEYKLLGKESRARQTTLCPLLVVFFFTCLAGNAVAQRLYSIGSLNTADQFISSFEGFRSRMAELGYREKDNVRYQFYNSKGNSELLATLAQKLAQDKVDLIVTSSTAATVAAAKAAENTRIPVLFLSAGNPERLIKSYSGSGKNLAGISSASMELVEKRFELITELKPTTKKIALFQNPQGVNNKSSAPQMRNAAARLGLKLWEVNVANIEDIEKAAPGVNRSLADAIFTAPEALITQGIDVIVKQAIREKMPLICHLFLNVQQGALATYAPDYRALGKQAAALADKIFKGANPGSLPIEMPDKVNLAINLRTAKAIDLNIPKELLIRADHIFE